MNGYKGYRASDASENPDRGEVVLSLKTVQKMLPLVQRIVDDLLDSQRALVRLQPEEEMLDRRKRTLDWPGRQRRYRLKEEIARVENGLLAARDELEVLGVVLLDGEAGRVGFPTMVNNRRAFFSWHAGEDGLHSWHFEEETECRPIPPAWLKEISVTAST
jgi:hypothetical protein